MAVKKFEIIKQYIFSSFPNYNLVNETKTSLSFKKDVPGSSPNCTIAGCLLFLGIIPGIAYYFLAKKDAKTFTINFHIPKEGNIRVTGNEPNIHKITERVREIK